MGTGTDSGRTHAGVIGAARGLFAPIPAAPAPVPPPGPGVSPPGGPDRGAPADANGNGVPDLLEQLMLGTVAAPAGRPSAPPDASGLAEGAQAAGGMYDAAATATADLDERLSAEINDAVSQNQQARDRITAILREMATYRTAMAGSADPLALSEYQQHLERGLATVQQILDEARVAAGVKQQLLADIAEQYRTSAPPDPAGPSDPAPATAEAPDTAAPAPGPAEDSAAHADPAPESAGGQPPGADPAPGPAASDPAPAPALMDPFAGLGPLGMTPMTGAGLGEGLGALGGLGGSLGSSLAGLGGVPLGVLGPALSGLSGLGALGGLGQLGGPGGGFTDQAPPKTADGAATDPGGAGPGAFTDSPPAAAKDSAAQPAAAKDSTAAPAAGQSTAAPGSPAGKPLAAEAGFVDGSGPDSGAGQGRPPASTDTGAGGGPAGPAPVTAAPASAVPASAPGPAMPPETGRSVRLPDGTPVTAPTEQAARAAQAVIGGTSVTEAYRAQGIDIPPPGTPVTVPVDPSRLAPGDIARFATRPPVMALGNGTIWMDGRAQPLSALGSSGDFLGWSSPSRPAPGPAAPAPAAAAAPGPGGSS